MTRKPMGVPKRTKPKLRCPKCGFDETEKDGRDTVCSNCGSLIKKG